jgi:hypothetical protein
MAKGKTEMTAGQAKAVLAKLRAGRKKTMEVYLAEEKPVDKKTMAADLMEIYGQDCKKELEVLSVEKVMTALNRDLSDNGVAFKFHRTLFDEAFKAWSEKNAKGGKTVAAADDGVEPKTVKAPKPKKFTAPAATPAVETMTEEKKDIEDKSADNKFDTFDLLSKSLSPAAKTE